MNKWKLDKTLPREVILAIVFMKRIHRRGLDFLGGPKTFTNFTGKQLLESFFNKVAGLQADSNTGVFL